MTTTTREMGEGSLRCSANHAPLTPISFLERSAIVYADHVSLAYGSKTYTWKQTRDRCLLLASALSRLRLSRCDVVAALAPNIPAMYELHFGIAMAGAVLCTLNTRHNAPMISVLLGHSEAKFIFVDTQFLHVVEEALRLMPMKNLAPPIIIQIFDDCGCGSPSKSSSSSSYMEYESLLATGQLQFEIRWPVNELEPITLNYTSGTTSRPKGVIYNHRGAYLNAIASVLLNEMPSMPVYLWTVPMFHCNGWCMAWGVAVQGGTNVCLRNVSARTIFDNISMHRVTHMSCAPTVLNMIVNSPAGEHKPLPGKVVVSTGGAPPPPQVLFKMEEHGFHVIHSYGLTETYGPATVCTWKPEWNSLPPLERAKLKSRQGVHHVALQEVDVKDPVTMESVHADGKAMGEVMIRGNTVMSGYLKDLKLTEETLAGGWFRSGDLGVKHPNGYVELKDRAKDIIVSGGENISTIEVESVLFSHPAVLEAAVVGRPDEYWGETPCAFVKLKEGTSSIGVEEIVKFCRTRLPSYMTPKTVLFADLPKTSTGKIQKYVLRETAKGLGSTKINTSKL